MGLFKRKYRIVFNHFSLLFMFYLNIVVTFAILYVLFDLWDIGFISDHYNNALHQSHWFDRISRAFYFSVVTLFSVGYGDITPFGWSRALAMIQAMFGYILPAVLVIQYIKLNEQDD